MPVFVVLAGFGLAFIYGEFAPGAPGVFFGLFFLTGCALIGLLVSAMSQTRGLIDLCYYLYLAYFLLGPAAMQVSLGEFPWEPVLHTEADAEKVTWLIAFSMVAYEVGRAFASRRRPKSSAFATPLVPSAWLVLFVVACCLVGMATIPLVGIDVLLSSRSDLGQLQGAGTRTSYQIFLVGQGLVLCAAVMSLAMAINRRALPTNDSLRPILLLLAAFAIMLAFFMYNPLANARFIFSGCILAILYILFRNIFQSLKVVLIIVFPFLIFQVLPAIKMLNSEAGRARFWDALLRPRQFDYLLGVDFDTFQCAANAVRYVEQYGLLGITNLIGAPFFFIPRSIWNDKPLPSGITIFDSLGYPYSNVSMPLFSEFYVAVGFAAAPLLMIVVGWLVSRVESRAAIAGSLGWRSGGDVLVALVGGFTIIIMRGSLSGIMAWVGPPIVAVLFALLVLAPSAGLALTNRRSSTTTPPTPSRHWQGRFAAARQRHRAAD